MPHGWLQSFVRGLCRQLNSEGQPGVTDALLLERWAGQRDEAAFELLLRRHAPLVLGVCQRVLHDPQDAEDAFQAAFLLLVRKANSIRRGQAVGAWLHRVALRVALRARQDRARRSAAAPAEDVPAPDAPDELVWRDLRPVLDEEIGQLPERYRLPFVLCNLQGKTNQEAADELGCPVGTILSRLHWARGRLRARLERRGVTVSLALLAVLLERCDAPAAVPAPLLETCFQGAIHPPAVAAGLPTTRAAELAEGVLRSMFTMKLKWSAAILAVFSVVTLSAWNFPEPASACPPSKRFDKKAAPVPSPSPPSTEEPKPAPRDWVLVPAQRTGQLVLVARELRAGEKAPEGRIVTALDGGSKRYYRLREGDRVEKGELLGRVDDRLVRTELHIKMAKVQVAEAERAAAEKTRDEAKTRYDRLLKLWTRQAGTVAPEELGGAKLTWERYVEEVKSKETSVTVARLEVEQVKLLLQMHEIHSPVRGTIQSIIKKQGEAAREQEGVIRIKIEEK